MNRISIQIWMMRQHPRLTQAQIARDLGLGESTVSMTLNGERAHVGVINWLINHGCPAGLLACDWPEIDGKIYAIPEKSTPPLAVSTGNY